MSADTQLIDSDLDDDSAVQSIDDEMHDTFARMQNSDESAASESSPGAAADSDGSAPSTPPAGAEPAAAQRDAAGRFIKQDGAAAAQPPVSQTDAERIANAPTSLTPQCKADWNNVPELWKREIWRREQNFLSGLSQYTAKAEVADRLVSVIGPFKPIMDALGTDVPSALREVLTTAASLYIGTPVQKAHIIRQLAALHGVQLAGLREAQPGSTAAALPADSPLNAVLEQMQARLGKVEGAFTSANQEQHQRAVNDAWGKIVAFGQDPKNVYFHDVRELMGKLMMSGIVADGDLQGAYDRACQLHGGVKAAIDSQTAAAAAVTTSLERAKRAKAARAAAPLAARSAPMALPAATKGQTMEQTMRDVYADIQARS
jgi:hypothetical protein